MRARLVLCGMLVTGGLLAAATPASAAPGPSDEYKAKVAKQLGGPYAEGQQLNLDVDEAKNIHLRVKSLTGAKETASLIELIEISPDSWQLKYFTKNGRNITDEVQATEGYEYSVKGDTPRRFRVKVKRVSTEDESQCLFISSLDDDENEDSRVVAAVNQTIESCFNPT